VKKRGGKGPERTGGPKKKSPENAKRANEKGPSAKTQEHLKPQMLGHSCTSGKKDGKRGTRHGGLSSHWDTRLAQPNELKKKATGEEQNK